MRPQIIFIEVSYKLSIIYKNKQKTKNKKIIEINNYIGFNEK